MLAGLLLVFGGAGHYAALVLGWKRQREFVDRYIHQARRAAWGDELGVRGIPGVDPNATAPAPTGSEGDGEAAAMPVNRRQKRMMDRENKKESKKGSSRGASRNNTNGGTSTPTTESATPIGTERKRVIAENGKVLIVDSIGNVYLEEDTEDGEREEFLLDIEEIQRPTMRDTMIFRLPGWCFNKTIGRFLVKSDDDDESATAEEEVLEQTAEETSSAVAPNGGSSSSRRRGKRSQRS